MDEQQRKWTRSSSSLIESHGVLRSMSFDDIKPSSRRVRYDVTSTMDRLRSDMVGAELPTHSDSDGNEKMEERLVTHQLPTTITQSQPTASRRITTILQCFYKTAGQIPAILLIGMFHMMIGIPFGVSYFPIGWRNGGVDSGEESDGVNGQFPLPGKEALGIRMFLFSTIIGQLVYTLMSGFKNPIGLQASE